VTACKPRFFLRGCWLPMQSVPDPWVEHLTLPQSMKPPPALALAATLQTNVAGIYDRPPCEPGAQLIARLECSSSGSGSGEDGVSSSSSNSSSSGHGTSSSLPCGAVAYTADGAAVDSLLTSSAAHDTTGGVATKIREAAAVAQLGAQVRIALAGSAAAEAAVSPAALPAGWQGTVVQCRSSACVPSQQ